MKIIKNIVCLSIAFGTMLQATAQRLSVDEATTIIQRMKHKDICELHKVIFPEVIDTEEQSASYLAQASEKIDEMRKAISEKVFGKTVVGRVLQTLHVASPEEQEELRQAIKDSYDEYTYSCTGAELFLTILVPPVGILAFIMNGLEHIKKIEAQRAGLVVEETESKI